VGTYCVVYHMLWNVRVEHPTNANVPCVVQLQEELSVMGREGVGACYRKRIQHLATFLGCGVGRPGPRRKSLGEFQDPLQVGITC
jgi:hypothetical protein